MSIEQTEGPTQTQIDGTTNLPENSENSTGTDHKDGPDIKVNIPGGIPSDSAAQIAYRTTTEIRGGWAENGSCPLIKCVNGFGKCVKASIELNPDPGAGEHVVITGACGAPGTDCANTAAEAIKQGFDVYLRDR